MPKGTCSVDGCERPNHSRFLCRAHYDKARLAGDLPPSYRARPPQARCEREGCDGPLKARGLCAKHYNAQREASNVPCSIEDCPRPVLSRGWCGSHYFRWKRHGDPVATPVWRDLAAETPEGMRLCRTCREFLPLDQFRRRIERPGAPHSSKCRACVAQYWQDNRERALAAKAAANFGVTAAEYTTLVSGVVPRLRQAEQPVRQATPCRPLSRDRPCPGRSVPLVQHRSRPGRRQPGPPASAR